MLQINQPSYTQNGISSMLPQIMPPSGSPQLPTTLIPDWLQMQRTQQPQSSFPQQAIMQLIGIIQALVTIVGQLVNSMVKPLGMGPLFGGKEGLGLPQNGSCVPQPTKAGGLSDILTKWLAPDSSVGKLLGQAGSWISDKFSGLFGKDGALGGIFDKVLSWGGSIFGGAAKGIGGLVGKAASAIGSLF